MNSEYIFCRLRKIVIILSKLKKKRVSPPDIFISGPSVSRKMLDNCIPDEDTLLLARNYWMQFDYNNSIYTRYPVIVQHAVVDHLYLLSLISEKRACFYLAEVLTKAGCNSSVFRLFINTYGQRLCDPMSPVCNPDLFIRVATRILNQTEMPEDNKNIVHHWLELARNTDTESSINNMYNTG